MSKIDYLAPECIAATGAQSFRAIMSSCVDRENNIIEALGLINEVIDQHSSEVSDDYIDFGHLMDASLELKVLSPLDVSGFKNGEDPVVIKNSLTYASKQHDIIMSEFRDIFDVYACELGRLIDLKLTLELELSNINSALANIFWPAIQYNFYTMSASEDGATEEEDTKLEINLVISEWLKTRPSSAGSTEEEKLKTYCTQFLEILNEYPSSADIAVVYADDINDMQLAVKDTIYETNLLACIENIMPYDITLFGKNALVIDDEYTAKLADRSETDSRMKYDLLIKIFGKYPEKAAELYTVDSKVSSDWCFDILKLSEEQAIKAIDTKAKTLSQLDIKETDANLGANRNSTQRLSKKISVMNNFGSK